MQVADHISLSMPGIVPTARLPFIVSSSQASASSSLPILGRMISNNCELNVSNDSSSPTLSDSGISVDAASNGSSARGTASIENTLNHLALTNVLSLSSSATGMLFHSVLVTSVIYACYYLRRSSAEVMFLVWSVCLSVRRITRKLVNGF